MILPKFRAWHKELKIMRSVHHMWWHFEPLQLFNIECISPDAKTYESWNTFTEEIELMQWTGFVDVNDKPIFADDIVKYDIGSQVCMGRIVWSIKFGCWNIIRPNKPLDEAAMWVLFDWPKPKGWPTVMGNIYENSDLLQDIK